MAIKLVSLGKTVHTMEEHLCLITKSASKNKEVALILSSQME
jgi:hypothetical protein